MEIDDIKDVLKETYSKINNTLIDNTGNELKDYLELIPKVNDILDYCKKICNVSDGVKLSYAMKGIAYDKNVETSINALRNYVDNPERAFYISNTLRKILLSNSKIGSTIMGYIVGEITYKKREFTNEDIILLNALENMTDFDIRNFKQLMIGKYLNNDIGREYFDTTKFPADKKIEYEELLEFGDKYRLFSVESSSLMESDESILSIGNEYSPKRVSQTLITYIDKVKQIYDFDL